MPDTPAEIWQRCLAYCQQAGFTVEELRGYGVDGYVWQATNDHILKVFRPERDAEFNQELAVYERLQDRETHRLQGFNIPHLLNYRSDLLVLELSYVQPPFVLDFANATLGAPPAGFDPESPDWIREKRALYGPRWPDVVRLLDALRHIGIHYPDVHLGNIRADE
jgi:hypothetical protein